jgi:Na+-driven multidrug efflux pump
VRESEQRLTTREVFRTWWPLAASWILMALEGPFQTIFVARLPDPTIHLAAFGSLVLPIAMLIEAPIIMMLSASTALSTDLDSYRRIRRLMHRLSAGLTLLHVLLALTPLYGLLVVNVLHAPPETVGPARVGFVLMIPWTWAIAYRRFNQGVLIRFGRSMAVGIGTLIRLSANAVVLTLGFTAFRVPGTTLACLAVICGVLSEATYAGLSVRPVLRSQLPRESESKPLSTRAFLRFYVPLSLTSLILMGIRPLLSAAVGRMPNALDSLAVLPVVNGLVFLFRSVGAAYNEVVIAHLDRPESSVVLARFARRLALVTALGLLAITATPLAQIWFGTISGLDASLSGLARSGLWITILLPAFAATQSYLQGIIMHSKRTRSISEGVFVYLAVSVVVLGAGMAWGGTNGAYVALASMAVGELLRTLWFFWRSRAPRRTLRERDRGHAIRVEA